MNARLDALARLLGDDDPHTVRLVKEQLVRGGPAMLPDLEALLRSDHPATTEHVRAVIAEIGQRAADKRLTELLAGFDDPERLEDACWLLAEAMLPGIDTSRYRRLLDAWGEQLEERTRGCDAPADRVAALRTLLCTELGFRGNARDYYNPGNSLLPSVIDTRLGIPISLAILFMRVAARAGFRVEGVNLPGHFIARHEGVLFDPFHEARLLSLRDCAEILARHNQALTPGRLDPAPARSIVVRMLTNLLHLYEQRGEPANRERVARWIDAIAPQTEFES